MRFVRKSLVLPLALAAGAAGLVALVPPTAATATPAPPSADAANPAPSRPGTSDNFNLVGHNPLANRGMNAAPALYNQYVYIGNRTDASEGHRRPGVLVVDAGDPRNPKIVGEIGAPNEGNVGETSRELRVWPDQKLLMVMNFSCSSLIHACPGIATTSTIKFYDLTDPVHPVLVNSYVPTARPHEMYLWVDPNRPKRALLYISTPTGDVTGPNLIVADISKVREAPVPEIVRFNPNRQFSPELRESSGVALHSMALNYEGTQLHLSYLGGGYLVADSSELASAKPDAKIRLITPTANRVRYDRRPGAHSAVPIPGRPYAILTEEVYGDLLDITGDDHGCPWGWVKIADVSNPREPKVVSQYRLRENRPAYCETPAGSAKNNTERTSYAAHNPTVLPNLTFVTWHSGGIRAFSHADPANPQETGYFLPDPLNRVATEDPALSEGRNKVVMWSYPIIRNGLIYVTDVRNGLYILRYTGPGHVDQVDGIGFLEGNSNLGDARRLEREGEARQR